MPNLIHKIFIYFFSTLLVSPSHSLVILYHMQMTSTNLITNRILITQNIITPSTCRNHSNCNTWIAVKFVGDNEHEKKREIVVNLFFSEYLLQWVFTSFKFHCWKSYQLISCDFAAALGFQFPFSVVVCFFF